MDYLLDLVQGDIEVPEVVGPDELVRWLVLVQVDELAEAEHANSLHEFPSVIANDLDLVQIHILRSICQRTGFACHAFNFRRIAALT